MLESAVNEITQITIRAFVEKDLELALHVEPLEQVIDDLCDEVKARHIERVGRQACTLDNGFVFNDLLTDYERISDHCSNVAEGVLDSKEEELLSHEYHKQIKDKQSTAFQGMLEEYRERFAV